MRSEIISFNGTGAQLFIRWLGYSILSAITLGLATPWLIVAYIRWVADNVQIQDRGKVTFNGTGGGLIVIWLGYLVLLIITLGLATPWVIAGLIRWTIEHLKIDKVEKIIFSGTGGEFFIQWLGYLVITAITFGIATPWLMVAMLQWIAAHTLLDEKDKFVFKGTGGQFLIRWIGYSLLILITFTLATPWVIAGIFRWIFTNTELQTA